MFEDLGFNWKWMKVCSLITLKERTTYSFLVIIEAFTLPLVDAEDEEFDRGIDWSHNYAVEVGYENRKVGTMLLLVMIVDELLLASMVSLSFVSRTPSFDCFFCSLNALRMSVMLHFFIFFDSFLTENTIVELNSWQERNEIMAENSAWHEY